MSINRAPDDLTEEDEQTGTSEAAGGVRLTTFEPQFIDDSQSRRLLKIPILLENESSLTSISPGWDNFRLLTEELVILMPDPLSESLVEFICRTNVEIEIGGQFQCELLFDLAPSDVPDRLRYQGLEDEAVLEVPLLAPAELEPPELELLYIEEHTRASMLHSNYVNEWWCECFPEWLEYQSTGTCLAEEIFSSEKLETIPACVKDVAHQMDPPP